MLSRSIKYSGLAAAIFMIAAAWVPRAQASLVSATPGVFPYGTLQSGLIGWWTFDGKDITSNAFDRSGSGHSGSLNNFPATSTAIGIGKMGQALRFDGADDEIDLGSKFINTLPITISAWMNPSTLGESNTGTIIFNGTTNFQLGASNKLTFASDGSTLASSATGAYNLNSWTFVTATRDSSGTANIYVNGVLSGTANQSSGTPGASVTNELIGNNSGRTVTFKGFLDDIRIYNRVLSVQEINQLYNASFIKENISATVFPSPLKSGLTGWWLMDGSTTDWMNGIEQDKSGSGFNGALNSFSTSTSSAIGKLGQALAFDGAATYISTSNALSSFMSNATGTMSAWVYAKAGNTASCSDGSASLIVGDGTASGGFAWLGYDGSNLCAGGFDGLAHSVSSATANGTWVHAVWVHQNGVLSLWKNGSLAGAVALGNISDLTHAVHIGRSITPNIFSGYIDDVRVYSAALSTSTIQLLYNAGASTKYNFTLNVPQSPTQSNMLGWWSFDGKDTNWATGRTTDLSGSGHTGMFVGMSTSTTPAPGKIGQGLKFDMINDKVDTGSDYVGTKTITACAWIKPRSFNAAAGGFAGVMGNTSWEVLISNAAGHGVLEVTSNGEANLPSTANDSINANVWQHICAVRTSGGLTTMYVNGIISGAAAQNSGTPAAGFDNVSIGSRGNLVELFDGTIDDVRIYNSILATTTIQQLYNMGR